MPLMGKRLALNIGNLMGISIFRYECAEYSYFIFPEALTLELIDEDGTFFQFYLMI